MALDREIVRALETHAKAVAWKVENKYCLVTGLQITTHMHA